MKDRLGPSYDPAMLLESEIEIPVQVQGKLRARIKVPPKASTSESEAIALADPGVVPHLGGRPPKKVIVVPGRMVNVVV